MRNLSLFIYVGVALFITLYLSLTVAEIMFNGLNRVPLMVAITAFFLARYAMLNAKIEQWDCAARPVEAFKRLFLLA